MDSFSWWALILSVWATVVCIPGTNSLGLQAVFDMGGVKGEVKFSALSGNTSIMVNLTGLITNYTWKIHEFPVVYRGNAKHTCQSLYTGGMYDPSSKTSAGNYSTQCKPSMSNACAIGDLSGKHGYLRATTNNLVDPDLPLRGPSSIFGRSLVLYNENSMAVACAVIDSSHDIVTGVATFRGAKSGITGTVTLRQSRSNSSMDTSLDVNVFYSNDITTSSKNLSLTISDTKLPDEGIPSYEGNACPSSSAEGLEIPRKVNIALARNGPSTERFLLNVGNIPLTGSNSVVGKTFVLWENGSPKICASVYEVLPIEAEGVFDVDGVKGKIHFKQNSELSPTVVTADLRGLKSNANTYHVHVYRVLDSVMKTNRNRNEMCGGEFVAGHWNPYGTKSAKPGQGTVDQYEIGDLSGKYGTIGNRDDLSLVYYDYNLPLFGGNSILFRSLVIHYNNGGRWACTNINPKNATFHVKTKSEFIGPAFNGTISVEQASFVKPYAASHITTFFLDLKHMDLPKNITANHKWHVHEDKVGDDMMYGMGKRCKTSLAHYNPYRVSLKSNYSKTCSPMNLLRCELGDLSSKLNKYNIGVGKNRFTESENYFFSLNSILGRSIVVHDKNAGGPRLGCANIETNSTKFVHKKLTFKKTTNTDFQSALSEALKTKKWRIANVHIGEFKKCQTVNFILIESTSSSLSESYEDLKKNWPQELSDFTPTTEAECTGGGVSPPDPNSMVLRANFDMGGIKGEVKFAQTLSGNTNIMVNLTGLTTNYTWKIHEFPVVYRGNAKYTCQSLYTGRMYDPSSKTSAGNYSKQCTPSMSNACAVGDLSGKHGLLKASTNNLVDPDLPLRGTSSIFGRSLVLYNRSSMPVACALIESSHDVVTGVATFRGATSGITGTVTIRQSRSGSSMDSSVDVNLFYSNDMTISSKDLTLTISDTKLPDEGIPSYEGSACPTRSAKELEIPRKIIVPLARNGPSTERFLLNLGNTPLTGSNFVVGKTFVLRENGSPKICASIYEVLPIEAEGVFDVDGVKGKIHFKQNSELSPTVVTADLRGLKSKANTYHVHVYRVLDSVMKTNRNRNKMCGGEFVAGHWNPYGTKSAKPGKGTVDQYEIGDLSGKYGTIGNSDGISLVYHDYNLPLFGANSILFRSLVIHYNNGSRWACTNINPKNPTFHVKVQSKFIGPAFNGTISVEQASFVKPYATSHITTFFLDLKHMDQSEKTTKSHKWHVHEDEVGDDMMYAMGKRCKTSLAHYNPYQVSLKSNYSKTCGPMNMLRCELGDLSSKLQMYNIGSGKNRFTESENYFFGLNSILGRSIVVHAEDAGAARLGCSSLETDSSNFVQKKLTFKKTRNNNFQSSLSEALNTKRWRVANVKMSEFKDCQKASFILIESTNSNLNKAYEDLKKNWPQSLRDFTPATEAQCKGVSLQATSLILILAFSLLYMFV